MSAHCSACGTDMVFGRGEDWQLMTCPVCDLREQLAEAEARVAELERGIRTIAHWPYAVMAAAEEPVRAITDYASGLLADRKERL